MDPDTDLERFFTDAEEARKLFEQLVGSTSLEKRILVIRGVGAVGKSSLLKMYRLSGRRAGVAVALVAAEDAPSVVDLLDRWATDLREDRLNLPVLASSIERYRRLQRKIEDEARKAGSSLPQGGDELARAAAVGVGLVVSSIPVAGPVMKEVTVDAAEAFVNLLRSWLSRTDFEFFRDPTEQLTDDLLMDVAEAAAHRRLVLMLDTFEQFTALDGWLRDVVQRLPNNVLVVIAGRAIPDWDAAWPGWMARAEVLELQEMQDEDVERLVRQYCDTIGRTLTDEQIVQVVRFARGLPMAATTAARLWADHQASGSEAADPRVVAELAELLMRGVPAETRPAFEAAAVLRTFNADSLRALLDETDSERLYDELRRWPFTRSRRGGLAVHDTMREVMNEALLARSPRRFRDLNERAAAFAQSSLARAAGEERDRLQLEWLYHSSRFDEAAAVESFRLMAEEMLRQRWLGRLRALLNDVNTYPLREEGSRLWRRYYNARLAHLEGHTAVAEAVYRDIAGLDAAEPTVRAYALCDLGEILATLDRLSEPDGERRALEVIERSLALHPELDSKLVTNFISQMNVSNARADWDTSITYLDPLYEFSSTHGDAFGTVMADRLRAAVYGLQGNWSGYEQTRARYVATAGQLGDMPALQMQVSYFTWPLVFMGRYREAQVSSEEALRYAERLGERELMITILESLGLALGMQDLDHQAAERFDQGLNFYDNFHERERAAEAGSPERYIRALLSFRGAVFLRQGHLAEADADLRRALHIKQEIGDRIGTPEVHVWLGQLRELNGAREEAADEYRAALVDRSVRRHYFECLASTGLARLNILSQRPEESVQHFASAESLAARFHYADVMASLHLIQGHAAWDGRVPSWPQGLVGAEQCYREALVYALRYNRYLLDEALSGRAGGSLLDPIVPACLRRGDEGRRMLESLLGWWRTAANHVDGDSPKASSPAEPNATLADAELVARRREPGDGADQPSVAAQLDAALA